MRSRPRRGSCATPREGPREGDHAVERAVVPVPPRHGAEGSRLSKNPVVSPIHAWPGGAALPRARPGPDRGSEGGRGLLDFLRASRWAQLPAVSTIRSSAREEPV